MNYEAVCRTAPATPGLLITAIRDINEQMVGIPVKGLISPIGLTFSLYCDYSLWQASTPAQPRGEEACFIYTLTVALLSVHMPTRITSIIIESVNKY